MHENLSLSFNIFLCFYPLWDRFQLQLEDSECNKILIDSQPTFFVEFFYFGHNLFCPPQSVFFPPFKACPQFLIMRIFTLKPLKLRIFKLLQSLGQAPGPASVHTPSLVQKKRESKEGESERGKHQRQRRAL